MAIKRRSKYEDDEDDELPRRRVKDDDASAIKRRRPLRDEEDDDLPRKRHKPSDEENDPPPPRRKPKVDKEEDRAPARKRPSPADDDSDELDKADDKTEDSYEEQMREFNRKKAFRIKQLTNLSEGLAFFRKQIHHFLLGMGACVGSTAGVFLFGMLVLTSGVLNMALWWAGFLLVALLLYIPILTISAVRKCKQGPAKAHRGILLTIILMVACGSWVLIWLNAILQSLYFRHLARYLKDKEQYQAAQSVMMQHIYFGIVGWFVVGGAGYFLIMYMETLGILILVVLTALELMLVIRAYVEMMAITNGLQIAIARKIKAEEIVEW